MLRQISSSEWIGNGSEVDLCQIPHSVAYLESCCSLKFTPLEPQLPHYSHAVVQIDGHVFLLAGAPQALAGSVHSFVSVQARGDVKAPAALVDVICDEFGSRREELRWVSPDLSARDWCLWRIDDNGHREVMWYFKDAAFAEAVARWYTDRGHKQHYYVESAA